MTEPGDVKTRQYVVIDPYDNVRGPFESNAAAVEWFVSKWPDRPIPEGSIRELCPPDGDYPPPR